MSDYKNPVCMGSFELGTACGICERCVELKRISLKSKALNIRKEDLVAVLRHRLMNNFQDLEILEASEIAAYLVDTGTVTPETLFSN